MKAGCILLKRMSSENHAGDLGNILGEHFEAHATLVAIYPELRRIARRLCAGERRNLSLQPTALANQAVLRLIKRESAGDDERTLLIFGIREMQTVLIDSGRRFRTRVKHQKMQEQLPGPIMDISQLLHLQLCLEKLGILDSRLREVVELRFFLGLTVEETATVLRVSARTVNHDWELARSWLAVNWAKVDANETGNLSTASANPITSKVQRKRSTSIMSILPTSS